MGNYEWTDDMREISGFGGSYEAGCRAMVSAGAAFLDGLSDEEAPTFGEYEGVIGLIEAGNPAARRMEAVMVETAKSVPGGSSPTGAMMHACVWHGFRAHQIGWAAYQEELCEARRTAALVAERALHRFDDEPYGGPSDRPYTGQRHRFVGERGRHRIDGITMRDIGDCIRRGIATRPDVARAIDIENVITDCLLELERHLGIYPNVPSLKIRDGEIP